MKKRKKNILIVTISLCLVLAITLIAIPKETYQKWFNKNTDEVKLDLTPSIYQTVFVVNDKQELVGVKVGVDKIEEDQIVQKWNILTSQMNLIPTGYFTPITPSTALYDYSIEEGILTLNVSSDIDRSTGKLTIDSLAWTFCNDEILEIVIKVEEEKITSINGYQFKKISKELGTNYTYETSYLFESDYSTIVYYQNNVIRPVTYFYDRTDTCSFIVNKIMEANAMEVIYSYELEEGQLVINFEDEVELSNEFKMTLEATVKENFEIDTLTVNGNDSTLYQATFVEVE